MKPLPNTKTNKAKRGFTLVELIAVIAILALLAVITLPKFSQYVKQAKWASVNANANTVYNAMAVVENDLIAEGIISLSNAPTYGTAEYNKYTQKINQEFYERVSKIIPKDIVIGRLSVPSDPYDPDDLKNYYIDYIPPANSSSGQNGTITVNLMLSEWKSPESGVVFYYKYFTWTNGVYTSYDKPF